MYYDFWGSMGAFLALTAVLLSSLVIGGRLHTKNFDLESAFKVLVPVYAVGVMLYIPSTDVWAFSKLAAGALVVLYVLAGLLVTLVLGVLWWGVFGFIGAVRRKRRAARNTGGVDTWY